MWQHWKDHLIIDAANRWIEVPGGSVVDALQLSAAAFQRQQSATGGETQTKAPHRVVAALAHDHPAGEGLVVHLDAKCPLSAVESVLLDEVEVVHSCNLMEMIKKKKKRKINFHVQQSGAGMPW